MAGVKSTPFCPKVMEPRAKVLIAAARLLHDDAAAVGGAGDVVALTLRLSTIFRLDQMRLASLSMVFFWSVDAAVPAKVMVSPLTVRLKSGIDALSEKT